MENTLKHSRTTGTKHLVGDKFSKTWTAAYSKGQPQGVARTKLAGEFFAPFTLKSSFLRARRAFVVKTIFSFLVEAQPRCALRGERKQRDSARLSTRMPEVPERKGTGAERATSNRPGPDDRGLAVLLSPVKLIDEAALSHLVDEAQVDEVFRLGFARSRIGQGLHV